MSPEAQRIAIAEACGIQTRMFRFCVPYHDGKQVYRSRFTTREAAELEHFNAGQWVLSAVEEYTELSHVPNYLNDLNSMHEAEKFLGKNWQIYNTYLERICCKDCAETVYHHFCSWHATAAQRAEAFLKAIGKWKEQENLTF